LACASIFRSFPHTPIEASGGAFLKDFPLPVFQQPVLALEHTAFKAVAFEILIEIDHHHSLLAIRITENAEFGQGDHGVDPGFLDTAL
jgi:hypothetical protein